jgi:hypothetical protein
VYWHTHPVRPAFPTSAGRNAAPLVLAANFTLWQTCWHNIVAYAQTLFNIGINGHIFHIVNCPCPCPCPCPCLCPWPCPWGCFCPCPCLISGHLFMYVHVAYWQSESVRANHRASPIIPKRTYLLRSIDQK